jgi:hypothetical protein
VGILLLGDTTRRGLAPVAIAGFILAVFSAVQLARFGQTEDAPGGEVGEPGLTAYPASSGRNTG